MTGGDLNLPFLPQEPSEIPTGDLLLSGGVVVAAAQLRGPLGQRLPAVLTALVQTAVDRALEASNG